ncbi:MAG: hypothetical protein IJA97_04290 [Clostridia bacterium]|nr:hypothetical protein [Clostridia bacterium]
MRNKFLKSIFFVFILMLCSAIIIAVKSYTKSVTTFKKLGSIGVISMLDNKSSGYNELKTSIDQKYTQEFVKLLNQTQNSLKCGMRDILGDEYSSLSEEYNQIVDYISGEMRTFNNSTEYQSLRAKLADLKAKIDAVDKSSKQEYLDEFRAVLSEISTLNTKFNNQMKDKRDRLFEIKGLVKDLFAKNKDDLLTLRKAKMDETRGLLKELLVAYSVEIKELNEAFSIKECSSAMPFDITSMQDVMVAGRLETECYNEILGENVAVYSENNTNILS